MIAGPNHWPKEEELPGFKGKCMKYVDEVFEKVFLRLVPILSLALGLPRDGLSHLFENPITFLRLVSYPPHPVNAPPNLYGSAPHCDYGLFALLLQDSVGGLRIKQDEEWFDVVPEEGTLVMNSGDMLHRLSNGIFKATPHCVINKSQTVNRYSAVYFFDVSQGKLISPVVQEGQCKKFDDFDYVKYLMERLVKNYVRPKESKL